MRRWKRKRCGCVNATLPQTGKVAIRCESHRGRPAKKRRTLARFEEIDGVRMVRRG